MEVLLVVPTAADRALVASHPRRRVGCNPGTSVTADRATGLHVGD